MLLLALSLLACDKGSGTDDTGEVVNTDVDGDGIEVGEDCDDNDASVGLGSEWFKDADEDGFGDDADTLTACEQPEGYVDVGGDCDDTSSDYNPDAVEDDCTDPEDYNCDGKSAAEDEDGDGFPACEDCDDSDAAINPDAQEICDDDDVDEDCSGAADDDDENATGQTTFYTDYDLDGYGGAFGTIESCDAPEGYAATNDDCNDANAEISPGADEVCDGIDNNCNDLVDDDDSSLDVSSATVFYVDGDSDGYGSPSGSTFACDLPEGYARTDDDCKDADPDIHPGAPEVCDSVDNDCDTLIDDDDDSLDASGADIFYADTDTDGYGSATDTTVACALPSGYLTNSEDCDDTDAAINPAATEVCDGDDNDCDGDVDDADSSLDASTTSTFYADEDSDGYGDAASTVSTCDAPSGYTTDNTDCDDTNSSVNPGGTEVCDGDNADEDCNGYSDDDDTGVDTSTYVDYYLDDDGDGYGDSSSSTAQCDQPSGYTDDDTDCDDTDATVYEGARERADGVDNDCDGTVDEGTIGSTPTDEYLLTAMPWRYTGSGSSDYWGYDVAIGDVNDDGDNDMLVLGWGDDSGVSNGGSVAVTFGPAGVDVVTQGNEDLLIRGREPSDYLDTVAVGDVDGDGDDDVLIGSRYSDQGGSNYGTVFLFRGPVTASTYTTTGYDAAYTGGSYAEYLGHELAILGDMDGDGYNEVGATASANYGAAHVFTGPLATGLTTASSGASATWSGSSLSSSIQGITGGDFDGDGYVDMAVGAAGEDSSAGRVYILDGPTTGGTLSSSTAVATIDGEASGDYLGGDVAGVEDVDGDGNADLLISARGNDDGGSSAGKVYLFLGPITGALDATDAELILVGEEASDQAGLAVADLGDMDGDGLSDIGIGSYDRAYVLYGPGTGLLDLKDADAYFESTADQVASLAGGDLDGDGVSDMLVGAYLEDSGTTNAGEAYVVPGVLDSFVMDEAMDVTVSASSGPAAVLDYNGDGTDDLFTRWNTSQGRAYINLGPVTADNTYDLYAYGDNSGDLAFSAMSDGGGNANGDTYEDLVVGAQRNDDGGTYAGAVYILTGRATTSNVDASTGTYFTGENAYDYMGLSVEWAGAVDGGTVDWIIAGAPYNDDVDTDAGRAYLVDLPNSSGDIGTYAWTVFEGDDVDDMLGWDVAGNGDLNGDGYMDVAVAAPYADDQAYEAGSVYVFYGPVSSGTFYGTDADAIVTGESAYDNAGYAITMNGDFDDDGYEDLVVGAPGADPNGSASGAAYVALGPVSNMDLGSADFVEEGTEAGENLGSYVAYVGDLDGDGTQDFSASSHYADTVASNSGKVAVVFGPTATSSIYWYGSGSSDYAGYSVVGGDLDGDGSDDDWGFYSNGEFNLLLND